jgi:hypothetical protein
MGSWEHLVAMNPRENRNHAVGNYHSGILQDEWHLTLGTWLHFCEARQKTYFISQLAVPAAKVISIFFASVKNLNFPENYSPKAEFRVCLHSRE